MRIFNSLTRKIERFKPIDPQNALPAARLRAGQGRRVGMYTCGPTVYWNQHIGHMRRYIGDDILRRILAANGYEVKQVMNITDVGHLTSDADEGEDKMEKGARKLGKTVWEVAKMFEEQFFTSTDALNILRPHIICRATQHIDDQISLIKRLEENGFAYQTSTAVYFDVTKFKDYGRLSGQKLEDLRVGVRDDVVVDKEKRHPADFALWVFTQGVHKDHTMRWKSPWGEGFPGWHIECSAMSMKYLGETFDIHTGGIDHIPIHHTNEIAQSEAATGKPFVRYFVHHEFLMVEGRKMSKSLGNMYTVDDIIKKGFDPIALRYLFLTAHYKDPLNFTWRSLEASQNALENLKSQISNLKSFRGRTTLSEEKNKKVEDYSLRFRKALNDDLDTPKTLAILWEVLKSSIPSEDKYDLALSFDEVLGLRLASNLESRISNLARKLLEKRENLRKTGKFEEADRIRVKLSKQGYLIEDKPGGSRIKKSRST